MNAAGSPWNRRWIRRVVLTAGVVVCLWVLCLLLAMWDLERARAEVREAGGFATWEEFVASEEAKPATRSGAADLHEAIRLVGNDYTKHLPTWFAGLDVIRRANYGPTSDPAVKADLAVAREAFVALDRAIKLEPGKVTRDLRSMNSALMSNHDAQRARTLAWLCKMDLSDSLGSKDDRRAVRSIERFLGLADQLSADPIFVSKVIRTAMHQMAFWRLQTMLQHVEPTVDEIRSLDRRLAIGESRTPWGSCFLSEAAGMAASLENPESLVRRRNPTQNTREWIGETSRRLWENVAASRLLKPKHVQWQAAVLRAFTAGAKLADLPPPLDPVEVDRMASLFAALPAPFFGGGERTPRESFQMHYSNSVRLHQQVVIARIALRIILHRRAKGELPDRIDDLCRDIERNWFVDRNIRYELLTDGFALSSRDVERFPSPWTDESPDWSRFEVRFVRPLNGTQK